MKTKKKRICMTLVFILALSAVFPFCGPFDGGSSAAAEGDTAESLPVETLAWESDFEVVETWDDLYQSTKENVIVLHNNSVFGDGGICLFQKMNTMQYGYRRADGTRVHPAPNQGRLQTTSVPYDRIIDLVRSYCGNSALKYGNNESLFNEICTDEIDCASFVSAVLYGVGYENSRYLGLPDNSMTWLAQMPPVKTDLYERLKVIRLSMYFAEQKELFFFGEDDPQAAVEKLQPGDLLFFSYSDEEVQNSSAYFYNLRHVALVLGTLPEENCIVIAQGGGTPKNLTLFSNEKTVVKTSVLKVTQEELETHLRLFARPRYASVPCDREELSAQYRIMPDSIEYQPRFQLNTAIDSNTDGLTLSRFCASTVDYCPAAGGGLLIYTGPAIDDLTLFFAAEYDKNFDLIGFSELSDGYVLQNETRYLRFMCSREWIGDQITLNAVHDVSFSLYYSRQQDVAHDP